MAIGTIWVFAEADGDKPATSTLELLTKAREIGSTVEAVFVGANADALAGALGEHGATKVHAVDPGDALPGVVGAAALAKLVESETPDLILFDPTKLLHSSTRRSTTASTSRLPRARPASSSRRTTSSSEKPIRISRSSSYYPASRK